MEQPQEGYLFNKTKIVLDIDKLKDYLEKYNINTYELINHTIDNCYYLEKCKRKK